MSHSRIMAGGGDTSVLPANGTPFSLEPLFDAVDSVMTYDSASRRPASCRRAARRAAHCSTSVPRAFFENSERGSTSVGCRVLTRNAVYGRRRSPRVQLGRPILTQLVTRLVNAQEAGIPFDIQDVVEQTLVVSGVSPSSVGSLERCAPRPPGGGVVSVRASG